MNSSELPKIVVIGAGLAGLTTAYRLKKLGYHAEVFEARSRPGGRIQTAYFENSYEELGGKNILDGGNPENILPLIHELGLTVILDQKKWNYSFVCNGEIYPRTLLFKGAQEPSDLALEELGKKASSAKNLGEVADLFFKDHPLLRQLIEAMIKGWEGSPSSLLSPLYMNRTFWELYSFVYEISQSEIPNSNTRPQCFIEGGNSRLIEALALQLGNQIHYSSPLLSIHNRGDGKVELGFPNGQIIFADYLVLAVPCSTLRDVKIGPALLPDDQLHAIHTLQYGTNAKILIPVEIDGSDPAICITPNMGTWLNYNSSLMTWYFGGEGGDFDHHSREGLQTVFDRNIESFLKVCPNIKFSQGTSFAPLNGKSRDLHGPVGISWLHEEYSKGSYCNYGPDQFEFFNEQSSAHGEIVRKVFRPTDTNIFFAGEHTSMNSPGTMEGAVQSGVQVARMVKNLIESVLKH